jgi:hypothetical protein
MVVSLFFIQNKGTPTRKEVGYIYVDAELLIFGSNDTVGTGSCGIWSFGKTTELLKKKSDTLYFFKYWEKVFSLIEGKCALSNI